MAKKTSSRKLPYTPKSRVRSTLRTLWLRSRERARALREQKYTCQRCGRKQSRAKGKEVYVQVHHKNGIKWNVMLTMVYKTLLCNPEELEVLCTDCHDKEHEKTGDKPHG